MTEVGARRRDALVIAVTLVTGATDAIAFTRLGGVFTSVMTGNMVLLGVGVGRGALATLGHAGLAVVSFVVGGGIGARIAGRHQPGDGWWPPALTRALLVEFALFLGVAIGWWASGSAPTGQLTDVLLAISAVALGVQSSAVLRLNVSGLSTTYFTGTLTTLVHALAVNRRLRGGGRSLLLLMALIVGAALGAVLATRAPVAAPLIGLIVLGSVIGLAHWGFAEPAPTAADHLQRIS